MPIYEFYCASCNMIYSFLARRPDTATRPGCSACGAQLAREVSLFAHPHARESDAQGESGDNGLPIDDHRLEQALESMSGDLEGINEEDPRQAARLMRKFSSLTGLRFKGGIEEAIARMEAGEDPESIEGELGDALDDEDPFEIDGVGGQGGSRAQSRAQPLRDPNLYDMP